MREIALTEATATLSAVIDDAARGEPSLIMRHGHPEAVILGYEDWKRLSAMPSFGRLLMASGLQDGDLPERDRTQVRAVDF